MDMSDKYIKQFMWPIIIGFIMLILLLVANHILT